MLKLFAPAKINLHLHVTGKREDGYHLLDSLVGFADIGDYLVFEKARCFEVHIEGEFARCLSAEDPLNTVTRAVHIMADDLKCEPNVRIALQKNLPAGAGIGGGSADAAACFKGLKKFWNVPMEDESLQSLSLQIGSDVPVCLRGEPAIMRGIGDQILQPPALPELSCVLIWPDCVAATPLVYKNLSLKTYSKNFAYKSSYESADDLIEDLQKTRNDLEKSSIALFPVIDEALTILKSYSECKFARMSGSGSTVFGIFNTPRGAQSAAERISETHPDWWVKNCVLNKVY